MGSSIINKLWGFMEYIKEIRNIFTDLGVEWVDPYETTEGAINRKEVGNHRGLYYIYPEVNFYFGKAATNTVINRHKTHRPKLDVDLATLYGNPVEKNEPKWTFPAGWKQGVCKFIIDGVDFIPSHWVKVGHKKVKPGTLDLEVKHIVDVDKLTVIVWNLDHLTSSEIANIENAVILKLWPYCNDETYRLRKSTNIR